MTMLGGKIVYDTRYLTTIEVEITPPTTVIVTITQPTAITSTVT